MSTCLIGGIIIFSVSMFYIVLELVLGFIGIAFIWVV
jgi:hypothetical protein